MAYIITSNDSSKIVLERASVKLKAGCFVAVGLFFFLIGVGLNVFLTTWELPYGLFRILVPFAGLAAMFGGRLIPKQTQTSEPEQIVFDHIQGAVIIDMSKTGSDRGYIRYDEIETFDVFVESHTSSSSGSRIRSTTYYYYHVFLKKKDGGEWFLFTYSNRDQADAMAAQLNAQVPINKICTVNVPAKLSAKIEKQEGYDKTVIHWKNEGSLGQVIFIVLFAIVFISIAYTISQSIGDLGFFGYAVMGFILLVFTFVMGSVIFTMIKNATTRFAVSVSHSGLEYYEFLKSNGKMRHQKKLAFADLHSINYSFTPNTKIPNAGLTILTKEDFARLKQTKEKPLEALKDFIKGKHQPITLSITALNPVECLQLETWLQELILKKGNVRVG